MHRRYRLRDREQFKKVYRYGKSAANRQFAVYVYPRKDGQPFRLGVSVSKKIGNAVVRNRMRRRIKEAVRLNMDRIKDGYDIILIVRARSLDLDFNGLQKSILHVLSRVSLTQRNRKQM